MGQKINPKSLRLTISYKNLGFKKKRFVFLKYSGNTFIYTPAVLPGKSSYSEQTVQFLITNKIVNYFLSKFFCLINGFFVRDNGFVVIVYVEFFQYKDFFEDFVFLFSYLQKHLSNVLFRKRPVCLLYNCVNTLALSSHTGVIKKKTNTPLFGIEQLFFLGFLSTLCPAATSFAKMVSLVLEKNIRHQLVFDTISNMFAFLFETKQNVFKGLRLQLKGRINGIDMARKQVITLGSIPTQTLSATVDYSYAPAFTPYGTCGVKVFFCYVNTIL